MTSLRADIEELKRLMEIIDPAPWKANETTSHKYMAWVVDADAHQVALVGGMTVDLENDRANFIANARNTLHRLIAQVERMESALKAAREDLFACGENSSAAWEHGDSSTRRLAEKQAAEIHSEIDEALKGMEE